MKQFLTHHYIRVPQHRLTVDLIGLGGTGSQMLSGLARINSALMGLGHPGLHIRAWDPDTVSTANMGRQMFSPADLGLNKAIVLISRVNRFFGTEWEARPEKYKGKVFSNITVTCVDSAAERLKIDAYLKSPVKSVEPYDDRYYWLDLGNLQKTGQVVLGSIKPRYSTKDAPSVRTLKNVVKMFPALKRIKEANQGPSCSLAEALEKQDLFINSTLAQFGCNLLWKLIKEGELTHHGCYLNLDTLSVNPIKIS